MKTFSSILPASWGHGALEIDAMAKSFFYFKYSDMPSMLGDGDRVRLARQCSQWHTFSSFRGTCRPSIGFGDRIGDNPTTYPWQLDLVGLPIQIIMLDIAFPMVSIKFPSVFYVFFFLDYPFRIIMWPTNCIASSWVIWFCSCFVLTFFSIFSGFIILKNQASVALYLSTSLFIVTLLEKNCPGKTRSFMLYVHSAYLNHTATLNHLRRLLLQIFFIVLFCLFYPSTVST